jgi:hypothetical protein
MGSTPWDSTGRGKSRWGRIAKEEHVLSPPSSSVRACRKATILQTTSAATALATGAVGRDRRDVLDAADAHARTGKGAEGRLGTGTGGLGAGTAGGADLDVEGGDANLLAALGALLGGKHGGVGRRLVTVGLDLHATRDARDGLLARQVGDVDEGVVEAESRKGTGVGQDEEQASGASKRPRAGTHDAKIRATPKTSSPSATWGPNETGTSSVVLTVFLGWRERRGEREQKSARAAP